jgi:hypothetical protein
VDSTKLTDEQAAKLSDIVDRYIRFTRKLHEQMNRRGFPPRFGPLKSMTPPRPWLPIHLAQIDFFGAPIRCFTRADKNASHSILYVDPINSVSRSYYL